MHVNLHGKGAKTNFLCTAVGRWCMLSEMVLGFKEEIRAKRNPILKAEIMQTQKKLLPTSEFRQGKNRYIKSLIG